MKVVAGKKHLLEVAKIKVYIYRPRLGKRVNW